jgi:hypothetical protein
MIVAAHPLQEHFALSLPGIRPIPSGTTGPIPSPETHE